MTNWEKILRKHLSDTINISEHSTLAKQTTQLKNELRSERRCKDGM